MSIEKEKEKQEKMLAIESDVKNVERDMQDIQDLFRDLSKLVNVRIIYYKPTITNYTMAHDSLHRYECML